MTKDQWTEVLDDAARVGLLTGIGTGMYRIHPALPGYLAAAWRAGNPDGYQEERASAESALCAACAALSQWLTGQTGSGNAAFAYAILGLQRRMLGAMLGHAIAHGMWDEAEAIVQALDRYWETQGLRTEAGAWADRILAAAAEPGRDTPTADSPAASLWLYTTGQQASRQEDAGQLDQAERTYQRLLAWLRDQPQTEPIRAAIAAAYHELGRTAQDGGWLDAADVWYRRSLAIKEELGNRSDMAGTYHQFGMTAEARGRLDDADDWYRKALTIFEEVGDQTRMAATYHQLGRTAQERGRLDEADNWYRKALTTEEELGDQTGIAITYHQLGITAQARGRLDEADNWYRKALTIFEEVGDQTRMAATYHQLGTTAQDRGRLDDADGWYKKALAISEELGNRPHTAMTYGQLGLLAEARLEPCEALHWVVRSVAMFDEFPHPASGPGPKHLARLSRQLGISVLQQAWQEVTGSPLPEQVRDYATSHQDNEDGP